MSQQNEFTRHALRRIRDHRIPWGSVKSAYETGRIHRAFNRRSYRSTSELVLVVARDGVVVTAIPTSRCPRSRFRNRR